MRLRLLPTLIILLVLLVLSAILFSIFRNDGDDAEESYAPTLMIQTLQS